MVRHEVHPSYNTAQVYLDRPGQSGTMYLAVPDDSGNREILHVRTFPTRVGIATEMFKYAQEIGLNPTHSATRTMAGDAWARKVSGDGIVPRNERRFEGDADCEF